MKIDSFADELMQIMQQYANTTNDAVKKAAEKAAKEAQTEIKENAPQRTGKYAKSWKVKKLSESASAVSYVVYAGSPGSHIGHLLEHSHAKRGGGRTSGKAHIAPAEQKAVEAFEKIIKEALS